MNLVTALFFHLMVFIIGILPFAILYLFSDFLAFILNRFVGYRKKIIRNNIKIAFPDITDHELKKLTGKVYHNLADILLEGIRAFMISRSEVNRRHQILNPEIMDPYLREGKSIIVVTGHYGNWEWGPLSACLQTKFKIIGFYKPLKNKRIDNYVRKSRAKYGAFLASIFETTKTFQENRGNSVLYLMAADQSPRNKEKAVWVDFFGRETAFLHGPEKHARLNHHAVMYVDIRRTRRGHYTLFLSLLTDDPSTLPEGEITRLFAAKLESVIREEPSNWLWSHKRWKLVR